MTYSKSWWLLSGLSYVGPYPEVDELVKLNFYRNNDIELVKGLINYNEEPYHQYITHYKEFLDDLSVSDQNSFNDKIVELVNGSTIGKSLDRFFSMTRLMKAGKKQGHKEVIINGHLYSRELFDVLVSYEMEWPNNGTFAYDMANLVLLIKLGVGLDLCQIGKAEETLEMVVDQIKERYDDAKSFCTDAVIARTVHLKYLKTIKRKRGIPSEDYVLSIGYYSILQYVADIWEPS